MLKTDIERTKRIIEEADAVLITARAGTGVHSNIPELQENEEFWNDYPTIKKLGLDSEDIDNGKWFKKDSKLAWYFYAHRLDICSISTSGFELKVLLNLIKEKNLNYFIYTSYVDGAFQHAGFDKERILEFDGSIHHLQCSGECEDIFDAHTIYLDINLQHFQVANLPVCPKCQKLLEPNLLMLDNWNSLRRLHQFFRYSMWMRDILYSQKDILILDIGDEKYSSMVGLNCEEIYKKVEARIIRINPKDHFLDIYTPNLNFPYGGIDNKDKFLFLNHNHITIGKH